MHTIPLGVSVEATTRAKGAPTWVRRRHANPPTRSFDGAPSGATKCVKGVPKWGRRRHATPSTVAS
eukprot:5192474-Pyramimonas_sp.AAC.1